MPKTLQKITILETAEIYRHPQADEFILGKQRVNLKKRILKRIGLCLKKRIFRLMRIKLIRFLGLQVNFAQLFTGFQIQCVRLSRFPTQFAKI